MSSFESLRATVGREPITVVEIDLDYCQNAYGDSPCTALLGTTGTTKCFNTFKTCQDQANYLKGTKTYKFCSNTAFLPIGEQIYPCIIDVDVAPTQLKPEGFAVSPSVTVTFQDFPHGDRGTDPYITEREYTPTGTFFGKLRARNPYLINRVMRVKTGYIDRDRTIYSQTRTYFIDRMEGPDSKGRVRIIGKDILKLADSDKAKVPVEEKSMLYGALETGIDVLRLRPEGIGEEFPSSGTIRIEDEILTYAGRDGDLLTGLVRGTDGTVEAAHEVDAKVQRCVRFTNESVPNIINTLLTTYTNIDSAYIPLSDWVEEADTWLGSFTSSVLLSEPKGVREVIEEILSATGSALWWDDIDAEIKFKVIVPFINLGDVPVIDETSNILAGSVTVRDLEKERVSRAITYFGEISPIEDVEKNNFKNIVVQIDSAEGENAYGVSITKEILSRWTPSEAYANAIGNRYLYRKRFTPREVKVRLDEKDGALKTGDLRDISSRLLQDFYGSTALIRFIVTETRTVEIGTSLEYTMLQVSERGGFRAALIAPDVMGDYTAVTDEERAQYMFISNDNGFMSDGSEAPRIC